MLRQIRTIAATAVIAAAMIFMAGCGSDAGNTALVGTVIGAGVGALAGKAVDVMARLDEIRLTSSAIRVTPTSIDSEEKPIEVSMVDGRGMS